MTLCGKPLRAFPQSLEIASRFPHSHRLDGCYTLSEFKLRKESSPPPSPTLQAHPSIGKDLVAKMPRRDSGRRNAHTLSRLSGYVDRTSSVRATIEAIRPREVSCADRD